MEFVEGIATDATGFIMGLSIDALTLIILGSILFFVALRNGKSYIVGFILSTYIGGLIYSVFPYGDRIPLEIGLFLGKYAIVDIVLLGVTIGVVQVVLDYCLEIDFSSHRLRNALGMLILSVSGAFALLGAAYVSGAVQVVNANSSFLDALYSGEQTLFFMLLAPLIGVFLVTR